MILSQETITDNLKLAQTISFLSREQTFSFLGISRPTLTRYQNYIDEVVKTMKPEEKEQIGWAYIKYQGGFTRSQIFILLIFKQLVNSLRIDQARLNLKNTLKEVSNGNKKL
jgi:AraC-like DNA-binding protein